MKAKAIYESDVIEIVIYSCVAFVLMGLVLILFFYFSRKKIIQKELEKKDLDISKDTYSIHEIINDAIEHVNLIIEDRQGKITTHFNATRNTVLLNDMHFTNVIVNILDNAIKYSPDSPEIDIYTENIKEYVVVKIKDRGLGMSKIAVKRIFEKFYREHTGDLHNVKGHGLGLSYVKRIIEDHNCEITVESEKGKGSTFIIKIPLIN